MAETKPMNADIIKALIVLQPLVTKQDLPNHYRHKLALLMRGLEILGTELGKREAGAAKADKVITATEIMMRNAKAENGNQGA